MTALLLTFTGLYGLVIGSFLNVVIYRIPRPVKFFGQRSACPGCNTQLKWYHNIPVMSWLVLRGRCGFCRQPISMRYPLVELLNAALYLMLAWRFGFTWEFAAFAVLGSMLIAIFFIDLDFQIIPDVISLPGIVIGLAFALAPGGITILDSITGVLVGGGSLWLIAILGDWLFKKDSMGGGDIKMAGMLGAFLGWQKILFIFMASAVIGLVVSIALMAFSAKLRQERVVPFGPFLAMAALLAIMYGDRLINLYTSTFLPQ